MNEIERTIERFLDGDLPPMEEARLRSLLRASPPARRLLQERIRERSAARRLPTLHVPSAALEESLFTRLRAEGYAGTMLRARVSKRRLVGVSAVVTALLLLVVVGEFVIRDRVAQPTRGSLRLSGATALPMVSAHGDAGTTSNDGVERRMTSPATPIVVRTARSVRDRSRSRAVEPPDGTDPSSGVGSLDGASVLAALPDMKSGSPLPPMAAQNRPRYEHGAANDDVLPLHVDDTPGAVIVAAVQGGLSRMNRGDGLVFQDVRIRLGVEPWEGGNVSVVIGSFPSVTETRHTNTSFMLSSPGGVRRSTATAPPLTHAIALEDEVWGGVSIRQRVVQVGGFDVDVGGSLGSSRSSFHMSGEVTLSRRVGSRFAFEAGTTVTQMLPYDKTVAHFQVFNSPDNFVYNGASQRTAFYSIGLHAGLRTTIGN